jgi:FAD/FMN-containing dehydrogenase
MDYSGLTGKVITPEDKEYDVLRRDYNLDKNKFPLALVYCYSQRDAAKAIKWCKKNKVQLRIRTGGHHYEGYSTANGVLVIELK